MATAEIKRHWDLVAQIGCLISWSDIGVTLHHVHGGSMLEIEGFNSPGWAQKANDWLVIPINEKFHTGDHGIDNGMGKYKSVTEWEAAFSTQVEFLDQVCRQLGYNVWQKAGINR